MNIFLAFFSALLVSALVWAINQWRRKRDAHARLRSMLGECRQIELRMRNPSERQAAMTAWPILEQHVKTELRDTLGERSAREFSNARIGRFLRGYSPESMNDEDRKRWRTVMTRIRALEGIVFRLDH